MNILFIDSEGIKLEPTIFKHINDFNYKIFECYQVSRYKYHIIKLDKCEPIKLKICNNLLNFSVFVIKTTKKNNIVNIVPEDVVDTKYLINQSTNYESDSGSDFEFEICKQSIGSVC